MLSMGFSALDQCRLFVSEDVEETRMRIAQVMQPHRLRPRGRFSNYRAHMDFVRLPFVGVGVISFGEMVLELEEVEDYHLIIFCRRGEARFTSAGRDLQSNDRIGACFAPGEPVRGEFSADCEQVVFRIDGQMMRRYTGLREPRLRDQIDLRQKAMQPWARFVRGTFDCPSTVDLLASDRSVAADCEALLLSLWLSGGLVTHEPQRHGIAPATVKRAEAYIDAQYAEPITLQDIADAVECPVRTLLDGFRRFRGQSPMKYLKTRRLDIVRAALLAATGDESVSTIAWNTGFNHLGRFAADYTERFGERPSDTLRRRSGVR